MKNPVGRLVWTQLLLVGGLLASRGTIAVSPSIEATIRDAQVVALELDRCPLWTQVPPQEVERRRKITDLYERLSRYPTDAIRAGVALYVQSYSPSDVRHVEAVQKVFAFVRVFFNVPSKFALDKQPPLSIAGSPVSVDRVVDFLWPFSIDAEGQLSLTGVDSGFHTGPDIDAIATFNVMETRLARRFPSPP